MNERTAGGALLLISGVAASLSGTSGLACETQLLPRASREVPQDTPLIVERDWRWIIAGLEFAAGFVAILGPGIRF